MTRLDKACYCVGLALVIGAGFYAPAHNGERNVEQFIQMRAEYDAGKRWSHDADGPYGMNMDMPFCSDLPEGDTRTCDMREPRCETDTECMLRFGGDGGPAPAKETP